MAQDQVQAGAEMEITEPMIEAGCDILAEYRDEISSASLVTEIFQAMLAACATQKAPAS